MLEQHEVENESTNPSVAIDERMNTLEPCVMDRSMLKGVPICELAR